MCPREYVNVSLIPDPDLSNISKGVSLQNTNYNRHPDLRVWTGEVTGPEGVSYPRPKILVHRVLLIHLRQSEKY